MRSIRTHCHPDLNVFCGGSKGKTRWLGLKSMRLAAELRLFLGSSLQEGHFSLLSFFEKVKGAYDITLLSVCVCVSPPH
jgi:hypothetical protein